MDQFLSQESAECEVRSPTRPFTRTVCAIDETMWLFLARLSSDEEWIAIGLTNSSFLFVFCPVNDEHLITTGTKDCPIFGCSDENINSGRGTLSGLLASPLNDFRSIEFKWFIMISSEIDLYDGKITKWTEFRRFTLIGATENWCDFCRDFYNCRSSAYLILTSDLMLDWVIYWLDSLLILCSIRHFSCDDVGYCSWRFVIEMMMFFHYFFVCFLAVRPFNCPSSDIRLTKYFSNSQFDIYLFTNFIKLFNCETCYLIDLLTRYFWFPRSQRRFLCYHHSLKQVFTLIFKQGIPRKLGAIDVEVLEWIKKMERASISWKGMVNVCNIGGLISSGAGMTE
jgi:hypothetical protein